MNDDEYYGNYPNEYIPLPMSGESNDAGFSPMSPVYPFNEEPFLITVDALDGDNAMSLPSTRPTSPAMPVCVVRPLFPLPECQSFSSDLDN
ncbi:hypothetical protein JTE90_002492 [Oedothorax gibbosus]|uniref:Uncharacterized protein n=1 Tax=Oedothorax gibbosus TaxID=931172 RepID=A0AAV6TSU0_9ARAC|nr:hypothetical protein JTE90_002492 [Oedothorax gibbosus]